MKNKINSFRITAISLIAGCMIYVGALLFDFDTFESLKEVLDSFEDHEIDELILPCFLLLIGIIVDIYRNHQRERETLLVANSKLNSIHTTVRTVQNIIGNSMTSLMLYSREAKKTGKLSDQSIAELDELIKMTSDSINQLGSIESLDEKKLADEMYILELPQQEQLKD